MIHHTNKSSIFGALTKHFLLFLQKKRMKYLLPLLMLVWTPICLAQHTFFYDNSRIGSLNVNAFCQDADNFLWLATRNGLRRFDGSQFVSYFHNGQDSTSLADNEVHSLLVDREQRLWIGTANGLQLYVPESDSFRLIRLRDIDLKGRILSIVQSVQGEILCIVANIGIFRIDPQKEMAYPILTSSDTFSPNNICALYEDSQGQLWIGTDREGIICIHTNTRKEQRYALPQAVKSILEDNEHRVLAVTSQAVYRRDEKTDRFRPVAYVGTKKNLAYQSALLTTGGETLISTYGKGIVWIKQGEETITDTDIFDNAFLNIEHAKVNCLFEDNHQNIWIGCQYQGVLTRLRRPTPFSFWKSPSASSGIPGWMNTLYCDSRNNIWCTVEDNGIYQLDRNGNVRRHIPLKETIFALFEDSNGTFWVGIDRKGLYTLDRDNGKLRSAYPITEHFSIRHITEDRHKNLYVAILGKGVLCHNLQTGTFHMLTSGNRHNQPRSDNSWVNTLLCDSKKRLWIGHFGNIRCFDLTGRNFLDIPFTPDIQSNSFFTLAEENEGHIWMGTRNGLVCYDPKSNKYSVMTTAHGLSDDLICGLVKDSQGDLWCSTTRGISHINGKTHKVSNYYTSNDLQENVFLEGRYAQDKNGYIYFGGGKGITSFHPDSIRKVSLDTSPFITDMHVSGRRVNRKTLSGGHPVIDRQLVHATDFHLAYADNTFMFLLSMMNYRDAGTVSYEYRLKEFGNSWNKTLPGENRIQYQHLAPGHYTMEIRACENGLRSPLKSIHIHIAPPWYLTPLACLLYTLALIGIGYLIYVSLQRKRHEREGEMKLQFFINIAHEIRSPLTLIVNPLGKLLAMTHQPDIQKPLLTIQRNANRILSLADQLLDIRRIDKGQMHIRCCETDLAKFIGEVTNLFAEQARLKGIRIETKLQEDLPHVWIDRNHFDKVLINLLSNALKYTPTGGVVSIEAAPISQSSQTGHSHKCMEIIVSDTGKGLNEKEQKKIFERFYQGKANQTDTPIGFGIGLNLCRLLVKLHHGTIFAENRKDMQGSRFTVRIPLGCKHLKKEELATEETAATLQTYPVTPPLSPPEKKRRSKTRHRLLIIDDDEELLRFLQENLSVSYQVKTASDGTEGWKKALAWQPDIILSDVIMPGKDGIQLLKEVKKNVQTSHIPVILLTSQTEFAKRIEGLSEGADGYLGKPFSLEELDILIENLITNRMRVKGKFSASQIQDQHPTSIDMPGNDEALMERVMKVINENLSSTQLNVEMLSESVGISRTHLYRRLKEITGRSPNELIRDLRLKQAATLLREKNLSVTQIAYAVGFTSQTHFSSSFKKQYGLTPVEYAQQAKKA